MRTTHFLRTATCVALSVALALLFGCQKAGEVAKQGGNGADSSVDIDLQPDTEPANVAIENVQTTERAEVANKASSKPATGQATTIGAENPLAASDVLDSGSKEQVATATAEVPGLGDVAETPDADNVTVADPANPFANADEEQFDPLPALPEGWTRITKPGTPESVWIHAKDKRLVVTGRVCLTRGYLELFACMANTKEHESVVALNAKAQTLHFALLAIGAQNGSPATWSRSGEYTPATGQVIDVEVEWLQDGKPTTIRAQQWVRDLVTKKPMSHDWVFGGSSSWTDPETKKTYYRADGGEVICVSNFPVAMMDLPIESTQANDELAFEALTENIPKRGTPIRVYLSPRPKPDAKRDTDR